MGASLVYLLVMIGYNAMDHKVTTHREMSWHISHSECLTERAYQNQNGRRESHNHSYVCLPVQDSDMRAELTPRRGAAQHGSGSGFQIIINID